MKNKIIRLLAVLTLSFLFIACREKSPASNHQSAQTGTEMGDTNQNGNNQEETREGMYRSELTNEWIDESLKDQRPVAIVVDNAKPALPHYGLTQADVVYEMMNSTQNGKITRLMALVKDWKKIEQFGSIRSARPTNFLLAAEWNAILIHDGGPFYINDYAAQPYSNNINGGFTRVDNGKAYEFTEYVCTGDIEDRLQHYSYSTGYSDSFGAAHFHFASEKNPVNISQKKDAADAELVDLPFPLNGSYLTYHSDTQMYYYHEYDQPHLDPQNGNAQLCFKNVILQSCDYSVYDENGYMIFHVYGENQPGYYITDGRAIPITWTKSDATDTTRYYDANGNEIEMNTGKTYIGIIPTEDWDDLVIE